MTPLLQRWKEFHRSFTHTPQAVKLVWQTNRWATIGLGFLTLGGRAPAGVSSLGGKAHRGWSSGLHPARRSDRNRSEAFLSI